jgi:diguanylate cyclase (GGDEF)-like protein
LLDCVADTLAELIPYDALHLYEADHARGELVPVLARSEWKAEVMRTRLAFGQGITGWAVANKRPVLANKAHLDPRAAFIPGTPVEPEALMSIPLIARGTLKGAIDIYRLGEGAHFHEDELELARWFGDAAALALDNAQTRARLEHAARTDSLTGLYDHRYFHERLRSELARAVRSRDSVALLMLDVDDFKRVNDVYGHAVGDEILVALADTVSSLVRTGDVVCRTGGEELAVIMPSARAADALALARRLQEELRRRPLGTAGEITLSIGIAAGPEHATNPRELAAFGETAMMTAKARGKSQIVLFAGEEGERPQASDPDRDARSIAHLKLLQNLVGTLNRLSSVREIGEAIVAELRGLVDYHSCRVYVTEGQELVPVAVDGEVASDVAELATLRIAVGEGMTGHVAASGRSLLVANALECELAAQIPGSEPVEESAIAVPLRYEERVTGVIFLSKLGVGQLDESDLRLLEVLAGYAAVALENARLYEAARREAENAKAWLEFREAVAAAGGVEETMDEVVRRVRQLTRSRRCSLWLEDEALASYRLVACAGDEPLPSRAVPKVVAEALLEGRTRPFLLDGDARRLLAGGTAEPAGQETAVPLQAGSGLRGWLAVLAPHEPDGACLHLLEGLGQRASVVLQEAFLRRDREQSLHVAQALLDFARTLAAAEPAEVPARIVEGAARTLGAASASLWLQQRPDGELAPAAAWDEDGERRQRILERRYPAEVARPFAAVPAAIVLREQDYAEIPYARELAQGREVALAPFSFGDGLMGFLVASARPGGAFDEVSLRMLSGFADQAKLAIVGSRSR